MMRMMRQMFSSGRVAPCMEAPNEAMTSTSSSISVAAHSVAINSPGNEPLAPTATWSPASRPASLK